MDTQQYGDPDAVAPVQPPPSAAAAAAPVEDTAAAPIMAPATPASGVTEIGPTLVIRGKLDSREDLVVHGRIEADITSTRSLDVRRSGVIKATVHVLSARIEGIVVGNITAEEKIEIAAAGRVVGDLYAPAIVVREGAAFRGNIDMPQLAGTRAGEHASTMSPVRETVASSEAPPAAEVAGEPEPSIDIQIEEPRSGHGSGRSDKKRKKRR